LKRGQTRTIAGSGTRAGTGDSPRIAAELAPPPLKLNGFGLVEVGVAIGAFGRSIKRIATDYDYYSDSDKARANELISKGLAHIADLWEAMNRT
jgi:hypothetical protein